MWPLKPQTPYAETPDGFLPAEYQNVLDPLETLAYLAGNTEQISLGTCVIDILFHNPVVLARRFATLDILSHGRVIAGLGIGWSKDEYEVSGVPYKHRGLGVTEFFLRFMAWLCLSDNNYRNSQMCIVTGPNIDIAIKLIKRMKSLFERKLGLTFANKETVLELNGCRIEAYPSNHIDAYRALDNPKFILLDEADFFRKGEQEDVRHVSERYIAKSDPYIVMVSTPNAPDGLFEHIEKEDEETCLHKRLLLDGSVHTRLFLHQLL